MSAIRERRERERAQRHQLIIAAARDIAEAEGWDAVTTRRLAEHVEYSQPVLYSHFNGKEAIGIDNKVVVAAAAREGGERDRSSLPLRASLRGVRKDPVDPGLQRGSALEAGESLDDTDPGLLCDLLGYNPGQHLVGPHALASLSPDQQAALTGHSFFPHLIAGPFSDGLTAAFTFAIVACLVAAGAYLLRGGRYHHAEEPEARPQISRLEEQHAR